MKKLNYQKTLIIVSEEPLAERRLKRAYKILLEIANAKKKKEEKNESSSYVCKSIKR